MIRHVSELYLLIHRIRKKESLGNYEKNINHFLLNQIQDYIKTEKLNHRELLIIKKHYEVNDIKAFPEYFDTLKNLFVVLKDIFTKRLSLAHLYPLPPDVLLADGRLDLTSLRNVELLYKKLKTIASAKPSKEGITTNLKKEHYFKVLFATTQRDLVALDFPRPFFTKEELKFNAKYYFDSKGYERILNHLPREDYYLSNSDIQTIIRRFHHDELSSHHASKTLYQWVYTIHTLSWFALALWLINEIIELRNVYFPPFTYVLFNSFDYLSRYNDFILFSVFVFILLGVWSITVHRKDETPTNDWMVSALALTVFGVFFIHPIFNFEWSWRMMALWISIIGSAILTRGLGHFHNEKRRFFYLLISWSVLLWTYLDFDWILYLLFTGTYLAVLVGLLLMDNKKKA
jgi:hypothetical protein